jgi:photosystem II stability/assembly factor-like uncharacterized protein
MLAMVVLVQPLLAAAQVDTLYMSILNSRKHRLGSTENPVVGLFVSTDGGSTWNHSGWREYIRVFYSEAGTDGTLWSACGNGILRSTDRGVSWRVTTDWRVTEVLKVKTDPSRPSRVFGASAYGVVRSTDLGASWKRVGKNIAGGFASDVCVDRTNGNHVLAASEHGIYRSGDGGDSWSFAGAKESGIRVLVQHPQLSKVFLAGTEEHGVLVSRDAGRSWSRSKAGLDHPTVYTIAVDPAGVILIGTHGGGVYRSDDGGKDWKQCAEGLTNRDVHSLVISRQHPGVVYAGTLNGGLFRSTDGGKTWSWSSQEDAQVWGLSLASGAHRQP